VKYFFDWEFHDDGKTIEPISIGIVAEDGSALYLELPYNIPRIEADPWIMENVVPHLEGVTVPREQACESINKWVGDDPEFWAYYADYDWVVLCQLFGGMLKLPKRFPKLCLDLQQWWIQLGRPEGVKPPAHFGEHHALADARWNRDLHAALAEYAKR